jgi:SET domain-containing protein
MLMVKTTIRESKIHGIGLFAEEFISKGTVVWRFTRGFDLKFSREDILSFPVVLQLYLYTYCWRSKKSGLYCFSSDNGKHFNHSDKPNCLSEYRDGEEEVITTAVRDIQIGEEITDNYSSFEANCMEDDILTEVAMKFHLKDERYLHS